ncbi:unnamed protein product [Phaedon cochleariae]|uniref:Tyrosine-protein kinase receptor n=1 Tax=Phaedon cochleariae TaxID=80249 RepID=A0A9N9SI66_PHACE|nr:unnamed protein product [Phaedon cochleariae]
MEGWQYCANATWDEQSGTFDVEGLQPYTKYRFRIALTSPAAGHLSHHLGAAAAPIVSAESVVISTRASGPPASPPRNVRATPVDATSVTISWEPGPFPHGPLLSYVLNISDCDARTSEVKDIPPDNSFIIVRDVRPLRNYTIEIRMRNARGAGPPATVSVSTPEERRINNVEQPPLILGTNTSIFERDNMLEEPKSIYKSKNELKGLGFHYNKQLLFIIDSEGVVSKISLENSTTEVINRLETQKLDFNPLDITVDWLNDQLYVLGEVKFQISKYIIKRCNFDGSGLTVAYAGLTKKPASMQIDPLNGYLFWTVQDYNIGGLFRLDINDISNGIRHEVRIKKILNETELGAFTFEYHNFNILVSYQRLNTIMSVTLDGKEVRNIRTSVATPKLTKVRSLAMVNKKFYWTDGTDVFNEEYHEASRSYFHNTIPQLTNGNYKTVFINLQSFQPWPTPINPPTNVEAIFGRDVAKTRWQPPHLVGLQGKGAWQNWSYEILIKEVSTGKTTTHTNITNTFFTITNLKENTEYILKVAAYTNSGKGPWSTDFQGITLNASKSPVLLWSAADGLLKSNAAGENVETIIDKSKMKDYLVSDIAAYKDQIYLVTNTSQVYWYNTTTKIQSRLVGLESVGSIAVDWIGMKLYWTNPKLQSIFRGNLDGKEDEPLISELAKELNIDSVKAYIYWSTGIKVECARLNGSERYKYHDVQLFSGKQVMGLTLDLEQKYIYWIVRGFEGSILYKARMQGYWDGEMPKVEVVSSLQKPNIQGPLCYFHKRLLWLQDDKHAAISDLSGKNIATISGNHIQGLNMVYVVDNSLYTLPDDTDPWLQVNVRPEPVDEDSIKVVGSSKSFNITWNSVKNVNYGDVFYEIKIDDPSEWSDPPIITTTTSLKYWREISPFTPLNITIKAFTYWASSSRIQAKIFSPSSTPSAPMNLRAFVEYKPFSSHDNYFATIIVRWDPPLYPNGVIQGFKVRCWYEDNDVEKELCDNVIVSGNETEYRHEMMENTFTDYYFQLQAFTKIGLGQSSTRLNVSIAMEQPVPTLLVANQNSIYLQDIDMNATVSLVDSITEPKEVTYLFKEKKLFWLDKKGELFESDIQEMTTVKFFEVPSGAKGMTIDWIERSLYYSQNVGENKSFVFKINLNLEPLNSEKILERNASIVDIEMSPFSRSVYWIETTDNTKFELMKSDSSGLNVGPFFTKHNSSSCNCPSVLNVGPSFTINHSDVNMRPKLTFINRNTQNITWADQNGCMCGVVASTSEVTRSVKVEDLEVDVDTIYWMDKNGLHVLHKRDGKCIDMNVTKQNGISDMVIYGQHMQPYPSEKCLSVKSHNYSISLTSQSANSLVLEMPKPIIDQECSNISMATMKYTIFYTEYTEGLESCEESNFKTLVTSNSTQEIGGLKPYTKYLVCVSVRNHFSKVEDVIIGPPSTLQTAPGVPSKPQNITAKVLSPNLAVVTWQPPEELNGVIVNYEIHWQTESAPSGVRQKGELSINDSDVLYTFLNRLSPNETYTIWVRVYGEKNKTSNDSDRVHITTYPEPSVLVLDNRTAYKMELSWEPTSHIVKYEIEFATITTNEWVNIQNVQLKNRTAIIEVDNLRPKTQYKFRLRLWYDGNEEVYVWPMDSRFSFETLGDNPSPPGIPIIQYVKPNIYKVIWEASKDNGAPIEMYKLEGKILRFYRNKRSTNRTVPFYNTAPSIELEDPDKWETFYNGTNTSWIINGLDEKQKYAFRVSALNSYGWSNTSEESNEFDPMAARVAEKQSPMKLILIATLVPISICAIFVLIFVYLICSGKRSKQKKLQQVALSVPRAPDVELATLRELPRRGIHNTNLLYVSTQPSPEEFTFLPQIRREQITLTKFLGSGAFGEVFEGKAKGISSSEIDTRVAVKTLKKGASDQEKSEFLQEAQLMSHFKHEHILQLLGVCLDNDPHFIIMELMEGGDLLNYLRDSRNVSTNTPPLTLIELLKMCLDVSKGCRYLEEMHFVHRDLACRNCLVSSYDSESRIVKIGDFGLARDIYKNDYYRKEGEGLLPVRWMAPESLVDGVFTSQSDVWAFGVLLWEIMTLGQQPYPARANLEVLHYVRRGGRLGKPTDCPEDLHNLMLKCWAFDQEERPTFKYCFEELENVHRKTLRNPTTAAHEGQYISTVPEMIAGVSNEAYFRDENHNSSGNSWKSDNEDEATKEKTPFLDKEENKVEKEIPKYLELIYEPRPVLENDGYEIPNQMIEKLEGNSTCNIPNSGVLPDVK